MTKREIRDLRAHDIQMWGKPCPVCTYKRELGPSRCYAYDVCRECDAAAEERAACRVAFWQPEYD